MGDRKLRRIPPVKSMKKAYLPKNLSLPAISHEVPFPFFVFPYGKHTVIPHSPFKFRIGVTGLGVPRFYLCAENLGHPNLIDVVAGKPIEEKNSEKEHSKGLHGINLPKEKGTFQPLLVLIALPSIW
jgi:hypothetical protein